MFRLLMPIPQFRQSSSKCVAYERILVYVYSIGRSLICSLNFERSKIPWPLV